MSLQLTQNDIEKTLADVLPNGKRKEIARLTHTYESVLYGYLNPDDERKSPAFQQLAIQAAIDEIDPEMGERYFQAFCALRATSLPVRFKTHLCPTRELGNLSKEFTDVVVAKCEGKPEPEQRREISELRRQLDQYEEALIGSVN
jgi:hypothetical protein